jgi:hypothetical protein
MGACEGQEWLKISNGWNLVIQVEREEKQKIDTFFGWEAGKALKLLPR